MNDVYRRKVWPTHSALLDISLRQLVSLLEPRKDELVNELAKVLNLSTVPTECLITLVPVCYVTVGGYSHPAVLDVGRFHGSQLLEAFVHELAHVFMAEGRGAAG